MAEVTDNRPSGDGIDLGQMVTYLNDMYRNGIKHAFKMYIDIGI